MYKGKLIKRMLGVVLCLVLSGGEMLSASAGQVQSLTPEVPTSKTDELYKRPVGGVEALEYIELKEKVEGIETFSGEVNEELVQIQEREGINGQCFSTYGYSTLTSKEKEVYNLLKSRLFAFDVSGKNATCVEATYDKSYYAAELVDVSEYQMTLAKMERIYFALEADYPMLFWLDDAVCYYRTGIFVTGWYIMVEGDYAEYSERRVAAQNIEKGILPFLEEIDNAKANGADDMELELLIHDMILEEVNYAYNIWNKPETATFAHSIVGVFDGVDSTDVVCEGYAKSLHLLATYAGLESIYAVGMSGTGFSMGGHAWNLVKVNGSWYNVDATWNDTNSTAGDGYGYDYFNLTTSEFNKNKAHDYRQDVFPGMYEVPVTTATKEEYYNYFGLRVLADEIQTEADFVRVMKNAISGNEKRRDNMLRFQCADERTMELLEDYLLNGTVCNEVYEQLNQNGIKYKKTEVRQYVTYKQIFVSISKIYVDNLSNGYVFGEPKTDAKVYEWNNRIKTDITEQCEFMWLADDEVLIEHGGEVLGAYNFATVTPVITDIAAVEYAGEGICPKVKLEVDGSLLESGRDYIVEYSDNINPGIAKVAIKGIGNYGGVLETTFTIEKRNLKNLPIFLMEGQVSYDGKEKMPEVIAMNNAIPLVLGRDFVVTYRNNVNPGQATVVVSGKGNYTNTKTLTFSVVPRKPSSIKLSKGTGKTLTFSWKKQTGASGYEVSLYKDGKKLKAATTAKTQYQFKKLKENTQYSFQVRAYKVISGIKKYSDISSSLVVKTASKAPTSLKVTVGKKAATLKWNKTNGVTGYEIYMSSKSNGGFKKVATVKGVSKTKYTKKKLKVSKTYYFKIRSYTTKNGQKSYSDYSKTKKISIK